MWDSIDWTWLFGTLSLFFATMAMGVITPILWGKWASEKCPTCFKLPISIALRDALIPFVNEFKKIDSLFLDGRGVVVAAKDLRFDWKITSPVDVRETKGLQSGLLPKTCKIEKSKPGVWTASVAVEIVDGKKEIEGRLVIVHLNEDVLFEKGDQLLMKMEKKLAKICLEFTTAIFTI